MKPIRSIVAVLAVGALALGAQGAVVTSGKGDLILGFVAATSTTGATLNYEVNLGQIHTATKAVTTQLSANDLAATYGAGWASRSDLSYAVVGAAGRTNPVGGVASQYWTTAVATAPGGSTAIARKSAGATNGISAAIEVLYEGGASSFRDQASLSGFANQVIVSATAPGSFTSQRGTSSTSFAGIGTVASSNIAPTLFGSPLTSGGSHGDLYSVKVGSGAADLIGTFTLTSAGVLTYTPTATLGGPTITSQPTAQSAASGAAVTFTVVASGSPPLSYQWRKDGTAIIGNTSATTASLALANVAVTDGGMYDVVVSNGVAPAATSTAVALTVTSVAGAPTITTQPAAQAVVAGASATFTVVAAGTAPLTYQWKKNDAAISGATNATFTIPSVQSGNVGAYAVTVTNSVGSVTSSPAVLTIVLPGAPAISTAPVAQTAPAGGAVTFSVVATGAAPLSYQWNKNGTAIVGATSTSFSIPVVQASDAGSYSVLVSNASGSVTSMAAELTVSVSAVAVAPAFTAVPQSQSVSVGATVTLNVTATGSPSPVYQWTRNGVVITGANSASLTLQNVQLGGAGLYSVIVANSAGVITSPVAVLTVVPISYAGIYFGSFGPGVGDWALSVRSDNSAALIAFFTIRRSAAVLNFTIKPDGTFAAAGDETRAAGALDVAGTANGEPPRAALVTSLAVSGGIANGEVSGQFAGIDQALMGKLDAAPASGVAPAGFFQAVALGAETGKTCLVVGPSGKALLVALLPSLVDGGIGTANAGGQFSVPLSGGGLVTGTINTSAMSVLESIQPLAAGPIVSLAGVAAGVTPASRLLNLSTRGYVPPGGSLTSGFVFRGKGSKSLLLRAVGSTLSLFPGITSPLAAPRLEVHYSDRGSSVGVYSDRWGGDLTVMRAFAAVGAFPLSPDSQDAATLVTIPGASEGVSASIGITGAGPKDTGVVLAEIYDRDPASSEERLVNLSTLGFVGTGQNVLVPGFVIGGNVPKRLLIRAVGPGLVQFLGVAAVLADPQLAIVPSAQPYFVMAGNNDWGGTSALVAAFAQAAAFGLPANSKDAAVIVTLAPGSYTVGVSGAGQSTGLALVEIYDLDP